jgi:cyclic pyranopterin phosphate synthase
MSELTHFDESGASRMVDVGAKPDTQRAATAEGWITLQPETLRRIVDRSLEKGDVFEVARLAGIMAAKKTADLIPLCHPLALTSVTIEIEPQAPDRLRVETTVKLTGKTGVEMEALTATSVVLLTVYDMCKAIDRGMTLGPIRLLEKSGGKSGHFTQPSSPPE